MIDQSTATDTTATTEGASTERTTETAVAARAKFAEALRAEHNSKEPAQAENTNNVTSTTNTQTEEKPIDRAALVKALRGGDIKQLAELLGEKETGKIANSDWAKHRIAQREHRRIVEEHEARIAQEREAIAKEREQLIQSSSTIGRAMEALNRGDLVGYLELSTGRPIKELVDELADDLTDPNRREMRALRNQHERERREREERDQRLAKENETREQAAAKARYMGTLKEALAKDDEAAAVLAEYGDAFAQLVFDEQARNWDGVTPMPVARAARNVIKQQRDYFERAMKVFGTSNGATKSNSPGHNPAKQGSPSARLGSRKSSTTGQGGPTTTRTLTAQERRAEAVRQLRAENARS